MEQVMWARGTPRHQDLEGTGSDPKVRTSVPSEGKLTSCWVQGSNPTHCVYSREQTSQTELTASVRGTSSKKGQEGGGGQQGETNKLAVLFGLKQCLNK